MSPSERLFSTPPFVSDWEGIRRFGLQPQAKPPAAIYNPSLSTVALESNLSIEVAQAALIQLIGESRQSHSIQLWIQEQNDIDSSNYEPHIAVESGSLVIGRSEDLRATVPLLCLQIRLMSDASLRLDGRWCAVEATGAFRHLAIKNSHGKVAMFDTVAAIEVESSEPGAVACSPLSGNIRVRSLGDSSLEVRSDTYEGEINFDCDGNISVAMRPDFQSGLDVTVSSRERLNYDESFSGDAVASNVGVKYQFGPGSAIRLQSRTGHVRLSSLR